MQVIKTDGAAEAIGPYSQAIRAGNLIFVSGQIPLDPATGELVSDEIEAQTHQVLQSLGTILAAGGSSLEHVTKTTVFLTDLANFPAMNTVYATYFGTPPPARSTIQVSALPRGVGVEIDAIAVIPEPSAR